MFDSAVNMFVSERRLGLDHFHLTDYSTVVEATSEIIGLG